MLRNFQGGVNSYTYYHSRYRSPIDFWAARYWQRGAVSKYDTSISPSSPIRKPGGETLGLLENASGFEVLTLLDVGEQLSTVDNNFEFGYAFTRTSPTSGILMEDFTLVGNASISDNYRLTMAPGTTLTLGSRALYNSSFTLSANSTLMLNRNTVLGANFELSAGTVIQKSVLGNLTLSLVNDPGVIPDTGITIIGPLASLKAPNFAEDVEVSVSRIESFVVSPSSINTSTDSIDIEGHGFVVTTRVRFYGESLPTSTPQIDTNVDYYVVSVSGNNIQISLTPEGPPINFVTSENTIRVQGLTQLGSSVIEGNEGFSLTLNEPNNTLLEVRASLNEQVLDQIVTWNSSTGVIIFTPISDSI